MQINPYVEPITPFARFDKKIVSTKFNLLVIPRQWIILNGYVAGDLFGLYYPLRDKTKLSYKLS